MCGASEATKASQRNFTHACLQKGSSHKYKIQPFSATLQLRPQPGFALVQHFLCPSHLIERTRAMCGRGKYSLKSFAKCAMCKCPIFTHILLNFKRTLTNKGDGHPTHCSFWLQQILDDSRSHLQR